MKRGKFTDRQTPGRRLTALIIITGALLFAGSVNADGYAEQLFGKPQLSGLEQTVIAGKQCLQENRISVLTDFINQSGRHMVGFLKSGWSADASAERDTASGSASPQPESIAFASVILLSLSLIMGWKKNRR